MRMQVMSYIPILGSTISAKERQAHYPMLEIFIVRNENDPEKGQGTGEGKGTKRERGRGKGVRDMDFFLESDKCLGLPPKKRLFKVLSLTLTSK